MKFRWCVDTPRAVLAGQLARSAGLPAVVAQCLLNRNLADPNLWPSFLDPKLKNLSDPFELSGMSEAVDRLFRLREKGEPVVVFGDYDVDGVTSTAVLLEVFEALGWCARYFLPHRRDDGYGLSAQAAASCLERHPGKLLLAVDCGSTSFETITHLKGAGVDVIILDHHQACDPLPPACAIVNPQVVKGAGTEQGGGAERFQELCSAGLAFKLAHALVKRGRQMGIAAAHTFDLRPLLDMVALGTIADVVPLTGENRILVSAGLDKLCSTTRPGLVALKQVARCPMKVGVHEVGFQLGPRLNAAGRLDTAEDALSLLRAKTLSEAMPIAHRLNEANAQRQALEKQITESVLSRVQEKFKADSDMVIVEGDSGWHIGVVGIVAARVLQKYNRPTIILGGDGDHWRGSGRSLNGLDLAAMLRNCGDLLVRHGGHALAAGVTIEPARVESFRARLNEAVRHAAGEDSFKPALRIDAEIGLEELTLHLLAQLDKLRPYGNGNPAPRFVTCAVTHQRPLQRMGTEKQHVKMWLTDGSVTHEAVWFGAGQEALPVGRFDVVFEPGLNTYGGRSTLQLKLLDWRPSSPPGTAALQL